MADTRNAVTSRLMCATTPTGSRIHAAERGTAATLCGSAWNITVSRGIHFVPFDTTTCHWCSHKAQQEASDG